MARLVRPPQQLCYGGWMAAVASLGRVEAAMTSRRVIKGVLHNFLATFTSRYSDFDGYWVFGLLVQGMDTESIDLLAVSAESTDATPSGFARRLAAQKFAEQIAKAGLPSSWFRKARLDITKLPVSRFG